MKEIDRNQLHADLCVQRKANRTFYEEFGIEYSQNNSELVIIENQATHWQVQVTISV